MNPPLPSMDFTKRGLVEDLVSGRQGTLINKIKSSSGGTKAFVLFQLHLTHSSG